jgi:periplasmic divalent cation tolerance protein
VTDETDTDADAPVTAYVTAPRDAAADLARRLVDARLAACVNIVDCASVYRWDGAVHDDAESILLAKTTANRYADLTDRVVEWHPHDVPCVERIDATDAHGPFAAWCVDAVSPADD